MSEDPSTEPYLTAKQAAEWLGISVSTLYAYVSRGLLRSEPTSSASRSRRYRRVEVERLAAERDQRRDPAKVAAATLDFGVPVLESAITLIADGKFYYRGLDAVELAGNRSLEDVAHLIWLGELPRGPAPLFAEEVPPLPMTFRQLVARAEPEIANLEPVERLQLFLPLAALTDLKCHDSRPRSVALCAARMLHQMARAICGIESRTASRQGMAVAEILHHAWCRPRRGAQAEADQPIETRPKKTRVENSIHLFNAALVLAADHELNVSSFTARCVASAGTTPYDVVTAGLAALRGKHHGGHSTRTETLLAQLWIDTQGNPDLIVRSLARRLKQGESLPGFGHRLYPKGDPRAQALADLIAEHYPDSTKGIWTQEVKNAAYELIGEHPTLDFALATVSLVLGLPPGAALALFALGRTVGWIGHALEQEKDHLLIRPRARYTGFLPG